MGIFDEKHYLRDKNGKWKLVDRKIVKAPHDVGRWKRNCEIEANNGLDRTTFQSKTTRSSLNKKVDKICSYLGSSEKVSMELITTSNKLSQKDKEKYKGIKGCDKPIKR